jgi:hypothetical protein
LRRAVTSCSFRIVAVNLDQLSVRPGPKAPRLSSRS